MIENRYLLFLRRDKIGLFGLVIVLFFVVLSLLAPLIAPYDPYEVDLQKRLLPPDSEHFFGTDELGRDLLTRVIYGSAVSLQVGLMSVAIGGLFGTFIGLLAGYYRGMIDTVISRVIEILLAWPFLLLAIVIMAILGPGLTNCMIALGIRLIAPFARLARGEVLFLREKFFIKVTKAMGAGDKRIMLRHILPNVLSPILVFSVMRLSSSILLTAILGFIGLGAIPPTPEWGTMIATGRPYAFTSQHLIIFPGIALFLLSLGLNLTGDMFRDILDPRMRGLRYA